MNIMIQRESGQWRAVWTLKQDFVGLGVTPDQALADFRNQIRNFIADPPAWLKTTMNGEPDYGARVPDKGVQ